MKILQINTTINSGSTGRIADAIGGTIRSNGGESFIAYSGKDNESSSKTLKVGSNIDVYKHVLRTRLLDQHGLGSKGATQDLVHKIAKLQPDLIHLHNIHGYYLNIKVLFDFLSRYNKPIVWTFHDCWAFTGHCSYFDRVGCEKWKTVCFQCPMTSYYPASWWFDNSRKNYGIKKEFFNVGENLTIVTPSIWLKNLVKQSFFKNHKVKKIHNGVDLKVFKFYNSRIKIKYGLQDYKILLGVASIWDDRKGLSDFIKLSLYLDDDYKIVLIGLNRKQIKSLPPSILGIERTEDTEELATWYSVALVYINPTYSDNFPTTNIEALACGTPVITYDTGGSPEAIDEKTGVVVPKGDIDGLKNAVDTIVKGDSNFTSKKCRHRASYKFNKDDRFLDYYNLYEDLMNDYKRQVSNDQSRS